MTLARAYYDDLSVLSSYVCDSSQSILIIKGRPSEILESWSRSRFSRLQFIEADRIDSISETFDFILALDVFPEVYDIQLFLEKSRALLKPEGRILVSCFNAYLRPAFTLGEVLGLKSRGKNSNWMSEVDIESFAELSGFEIIRSGNRALIPWRLGGVERFVNRYFSPMPIFKYICLYGYYLLRPVASPKRALKKISVIVPARNEAGNISAAVKRMPKLSEKVELIFVEGNSTDNTWETIQLVASGSKPEWLEIKIFRQTGKGKANAVHKGFNEATGELLMILDADLTVPPEELPRFVDPIVRGIADFTHGSRLVYQMEGDAMRFLNMLGNKFFSIAFTWVLGQRFKDTLCGTKVFLKKDWPRILELRKFFGDFDPFGDFEMIFGATKLNHKILQIPVHYKARTYGETNISRFTRGAILLRMLIFAARRMKFI